MNEQHLLKLFSDVITDYIFDSLNSTTISSIEEDLRKVMPAPLKVKMNRKLRAVTGKEKYKDGIISLCCEANDTIFEIGMIENVEFLGEDALRFIVSGQGTKFDYERC